MNRLLLNLNLAFFLLTLEGFVSVKFTTEPICLSSDNESKKIICEDPNKALIITLAEYSDDSSTCSLSSNSTKPIICSAYRTQELANECNGRQDCEIKLGQIDFHYGYYGSNCDFTAKVLSVSYECIPSTFDQSNIPKYNICPGGIIERPLLGFIHTPNYPNNYGSSQFCQLTLKINEQIDRIEIFLIELETEGLSKRHYKPTDYLQINNKEIIYGKKKFMLVYNDTQDAIIVFRTDFFFNQKGFLLYFETQKRPIELYENFDDLEVSTTTIVPTTTISILNTTLQNNQSNVTSFDSFDSSSFNQTNSSVLPEFKADSYSEKYISIEAAPNKITSYFNELTLKAIISLVALVCVLVSVIVFLVVYNRKKLFCGPLKYVDPSLIGNNSQFYDASLINGYLESNNLAAIPGSFVFTPSSSNLINQSGKNRLSDDSLKILLINKSMNSSIEPIVQATKSSSQCEVYDEIPLGKVKETHMAKVNEYCYIQANGLVSGGPEKNENVLECNPADFIDSKKSPPSSGCHSPNFDSMITSTPSAPKTLPPSKEFIKNDCEYEGLNRLAVNKSVYRSCFDETCNEDMSANDETTQTMIKTTIEVDETLVNENEIDNEDYNIDYQIPTNILISD